MTYLKVTGLKEMIAEVEALALGPSPEAIAALTAIGKEMFDNTQERVHVISGSLKASGKHTAVYDPELRQFIVEITYGGESPGSKFDPVVYAIYEMARGGAHDFFGDIPNFFEPFEEAMTAGFGSP